MNTNVLPVNFFWNYVKLCPVNLRFKFTDQLFYYITIPFLLFPAAFSVYWGSPTACCFLESGILVHFV